MNRYRELLLKQFEEEPKWKIISYLQEHGEQEIYTLSKQLGWSSSKTHGQANRLFVKGLITMKTKIKNGRLVKTIGLKEVK